MLMMEQLFFLIMAYLLSMGPITYLEKFLSTTSLQRSSPFNQILLKVASFLFSESLLVQPPQDLNPFDIESEAPMPLEVKIKSKVQLSDKIIDQPFAESRGSSSQKEGDSKAEEAEAPDIRRLAKHHSTDKSVAGGGVILGGLVTVTFAAVFCYIRVTRKIVGEQ
ncbi:hypothetical protein V8G54_025527 [Vigna mungo]|uniref:Uncharacterized protein n=1 Tax=Vigna mungo TaxID=3915 RepID=A0AAQ3MYK8_VIGMU